MNFKISILLLTAGLLSAPLWSQQHPELSLRLHLQPQVSSLQPYDEGFISKEPSVSPSFAFGVEASRNLSKRFELSLGYLYASQAGNFSLVDCDAAPNLLAVADFIGNRVAPCPMPRGKVRLAKIPVSLGWRIIQKDKFMSRLSLGPQIQLLLNPPKWGLYDYQKVSLALMTEWANYIKLSNSFSVVAGLRLDRSTGPLDHNSLERSIANSLGLVVGVEYSYWREKR